MPVVSALLGAAFTVGARVALGSLLLRRGRGLISPVESLLFAFVERVRVKCRGSKTCVVHQARLGVSWRGGAGVLFWAVWEARKHKPRLRLPAIPTAWALIFTVIYAAFFACYLSNALVPRSP